MGQRPLRIWGEKRDVWALDFDISLIKTNAQTYQPDFLFAPMRGGGAGGLGGGGGDGGGATYVTSDESCERRVTSVQYPFE